MTITSRALFPSPVLVDLLNNVTKFNKILIKTIRLRERTSFKKVNFHKQRAITAENMVRYRILSNWKKA